MPETSLIKSNRNNGLCNKWRRRDLNKRERKQKKWPMHNRHLKSIDSEECSRTILHLVKQIQGFQQNKLICNWYSIKTHTQAKEKKDKEDRERTEKLQYEKDERDLLLERGKKQPYK